MPSKYAFITRHRNYFPNLISEDLYNFFKISKFQKFIIGRNSLIRTRIEVDNAPSNLSLIHDRIIPYIRILPSV